MKQHSKLSHFFKRKTELAAFIFIAMSNVEYDLVCGNKTLTNPLHADKATLEL